MRGLPSFGRRSRPGTRRGADSGGVKHLIEFAETRQGVEGFVEPQTAVTETTLVFVAKNGEWTRRRVDGPKAAYALGQRLSVPIYDVQLVGYQERMRRWNRENGQGT